jgi:AcrR family transcriptional regulator
MPAPKQKLKLERVLTQIIEMMLIHHPSTITFSRVSRKTGVPRSTLYYYFGSTQEAMLVEAARFGMSAFTQLTSLSKGGRHRSWDEFQLARFRVSTQVMRKYPWAPGLYHRYRNDPGAMGDRIREAENRYVREFAEVWKKYHGRAPSEHGARLSTYLKVGLFWGLSVDPKLWYGARNRAAHARMLRLMTEISTIAMKL